APAPAAPVFETVSAGSATRTATRFALVYLALAGSWILLSDGLLFALSDDAALNARLALYKGWCFVGVTAALLFAVLRRKLRRAEDALFKSQARLNLAPESGYVGTWSCDLASGRFDCDEAIARLLGRTGDELRGDAAEFFKTC